MILQGTLLKLEAVLSGAVSANQPEVTVDYTDWNAQGAETPPATVRTGLNSNTDVTILAPPQTATNVGNPVREPIRVSIYNKDTATVTVTVKTDDGTTERIIIKATLLTLESLHWDKANGWYSLDASGNLKQSGGSNFGALTATSITDSGLTSGRVVLAGTGGLLEDDAGLTYNKATDTLTTTTFVGALTGTASAVAVGGITGLGTGVATALAVNTGSVGSIVPYATPLTNSLSGDVTMNNTGNYFAGPTVAQGTSGTWFASGTVVCQDGNVAGGTFNVKLWDGTTVIASAKAQTTLSSENISISVSGFITSPAGNIRIDVNDSQNTTGVIKANASGNSKDSTVTAVRVG